MQRVEGKHPDQGTACTEALRQIRIHRPGKRPVCWEGDDQVAEGWQQREGGVGSGQGLMSLRGSNLTESQN